MLNYMYMYLFMIYVHVCCFTGNMDEARALTIGLGGGALPTFIDKYLPQVSLL